MEVEKTLNTSDLLPTVLNLLDVKSPYQYIGQDAFDHRYAGFALFPDGSWVCNGVAYSAASEEVHILKEGAEADPEWVAAMADYLNDYILINNLILETDYYKRK